jgi:hypothetical protein
VRDPKVRLRGLGEIATNAPHAFLLQCTYLQLADFVAEVRCRLIWSVIPSL